MVKSGVLASVLVLSVIGCDGAVDEELASGEYALQSLAGSKFEIDDSANLKRDGSGSGALDWATVTELRNADLASGNADNSYSGGAKEDDTCPSVGTGSIPNNKSDLKAFGVYAEAGATLGDPGFLHMFWHRVQDPSGTTLMDFEFNQSATKCANGVNPVRTEGDLLIEYRLEQGGATALLKLRKWTSGAWGAAAVLDATQAAGTINGSTIALADSDGLGTVSPRTFGEATVSLASVFDAQKCTTFGSAFVKSRSSDSFTSALKDYIAPVGVNVTNCGKVIIRKQTNPDGATDQFAFATTLLTDPSASQSFSLGDGGSKEFGNVLFGTDYTVTESLATGYDLDSIDCSASTGVIVATDLANRKITFSIDADTDVVDCTYTNRARGKLIIQKVSTDGVGTFNFSSPQSAVGSFPLQTSIANVAVSQPFDGLAPGSYSVAESVPSGWALVSATCDDGSSVTNIQIAAGETVTCTFTNARIRGAILVKKFRYHAAGGLNLWQQHNGVTFTLSGGGLTAQAKATADGVACFDGLLLSDIAGSYTVTETVPAGYVAVGSAAQLVSVVQGGTCSAGYAEATFYNLPLTNFTVSVDSQVDGGTASTITCGSFSATTAANGDGSLTVSNLTAGTYTCTIEIKN